ncbi:MAG: hypothetical protein KIS94_00510 [Chitinophagales bacterium]|nr:hypothetical protein [Chitinophagales bacterium]
MRKWLKWLGFQLLLLLLFCAAIEVVLRSMGYQPGDLRPNWLHFQPVDSLVVIPDFFTNEKGLLVASKDYWAEQHLAINDEGFRGKDFNELDSTRKKILFIGDSFTWGMSASPFYDSSFCDLLARETDFEIINTGIPAADPPQYLAIAQQYIPQLQPHIVFVVFFMGNDLMKHDRQVTPDSPFYYWTNAGAILADIDGKHFANAQAAYDYLANERYFLKHPKKLYEKIVAASALLSRLYAGIYRIEEKIAYERLRKNTSITKKYLNAIQQLAANNHVPIKFILIPESKEADYTKEKYCNRYADLLKDKQTEADWLIWHTPKEYFKPNPDGHLNNAGHRLYADSVKSYLKAYFQTAK